MNSETQPDSSKVLTLQPLRPKRAAQQGLLCRSGSGYRGDGYRYWLPGREPLLWPGYNASEEEKQAWRERCYAHACRSSEKPASG